jgi:hypothetical protein
LLLCPAGRRKTWTSAGSLGRGTAQIRPLLLSFTA